MVYEVSNHWFEVTNKIELTNKEHKLITSLIYDKIVTYEELVKRIYGFEIDAYAIVQLRNLKTRLLKKIPIDIEVAKGKGFILKTEIYFK